MERDIIMFWICGIHLHGQLERGFGTRGFCVLFNRHIGVRIDHANDVNRTSSSFFLCIEWRKKKEEDVLLTSAGMSASESLQNPDI